MTLKLGWYPTNPNSYSTYSSRDLSSTSTLTPINPSYHGAGLCLVPLPGIDSVSPESRVKHLTLDPTLSIARVAGRVPNPSTLPALAS